MNELAPCQKCQSPYMYEDGNLLICPECGYEHTITAKKTTDIHIVCDANGTELKDGDTVTTIKDLKVKGSSSTIKVGTKIKNISLVEGNHNIDCKVPSIGQMGLKSEFVKKVAD